eukprot:scaffold16178_cov45-Isochrysis_galbana.AAC.1
MPACGVDCSQQLHQQLWSHARAQPPLLAWVRTVRLELWMPPTTATRRGSRGGCRRVRAPAAAERQGSGQR